MTRPFYAVPLDKIELLFYDWSEEIEAPPPEGDATRPPLLRGIPFAFHLSLLPLARLVVACLMQRSSLRLFRWKGACPPSIPVTLIALQLDYPSEVFVRGSIVASRRQRGESIR